MTSSPDATRRWRDLDARHHLHPFTTHRELAEKGARIITRGEGVYVWDSEGNRILDGMAGLWCVQVGHGRERLARAAYEQIRTLGYYNAFFQCSTPPAVELAAKLASLLPDGMDRIIFANSGSEANDTVIKTVWYYWNLMGRPEKKHLISRTLGYHGVGLGSASLTGMRFMHEPFDLPLERFHHIGNPYPGARAGGRTRPSSGWRPPAGSRTRSWSSGPGTSRPSLPSRSRVPGASSSRPTPTGPRCSGSAAATTSCSWPTR
jgi:putrescine aminotransferase